MAIGDKKIFIAVVVIVEKLGAPSQKLETLLAHAGVKAEVGKECAAVVVVKRIGLLPEVGD